MKLDRIVLENFKCHKKIDLSFPKITLLTGENSSGKSSIINGIFSLLQSNNFPENLSLNGKYVNLGDFSDVIFKHRKSLPLGFRFFISNDDEEIEITSEWVLNKKEHSQSLNKLFAKSKKLNITVTRSTKGYSAEIKYLPKFDTMLSIYEDRNFVALMQSLFQEPKPSDKGLKKAESSRRSNAKTAAENYNAHVTAVLSSAKEGTEMTFNFHSSTIKTMFRELSQKSPIANSALGKIFEALRDFEKQANYISSFRLHPDRSYYLDIDSNSKVGKYGEKHIDQILQWQKEASPKFKTLIAELSKLKVAYNLKPKITPGGRLELKIKATKKGLLNSINDVGFGVSQLLPIIVADIQLPKNSTLFLSQPEIHLHPEIQAELGEYLVRKSIEDGKRYVIETHSEYLLNRFRTLVTKNKIKEEDISVLYLSNSKDDCNYHNIRFNRSGEIIGAPKEFFQTYMLDVIEIALNS
jgi:predicted ATPase